MTKLEVYVILPETGPAAGAALRGLTRLLDDGRFNVSKVFWGQPPEQVVTGVDRYVAREDRVLGRRGRAPNPVREDVIPRVGGIEPLPDQITDAPQVIIDLSQDPRALKHAAFASFGLWRIEDFSTGPGLAPSVGGEASTLLTLVKHGAGEGPPRVISTAEYSTKFIASRQVAFMREKAIELLRKELARLALTREVADVGPYSPPHASELKLTPYFSRLGRELGGRSGSKLLAKLGQKPGQWCLLTGHGNWSDFDPATGTLIRPEGNRYWADPFLYRHGPDTHLFFEDYDYATGKGHISAGRLVDGALTDVVPVLQRPYHLSYPMVFSHEGQIFMLPETHQAGQVEVWRAKRFPDEWELYATALKGVPAADSVLFEDKGVWWLLTNVTGDSFGDLSSELNLYRTSGPDLKEIEPHPLNPVVVGSRTARGGGRVFRDGNRLLRASQNNTHGVYGWGLNLMEITRLDANTYEERLVRSFEPDFLPGLVGCHHFDSTGSTWVVDIRRARGHWAA